jgi:hypothetical protein
MNKITISLTEQQLAVLDKAIQELPMKTAWPLVCEINSQIAVSQKSSNSNDEAAHNAIMAPLLEK